MYKHVTVLLDEAVEKLNINPSGIYVDCTLGGGGHSSAILERLEDGHLYCFDQDDYAIEKSTQKLRSVSNNFTIIKSNFANIKDELLDRGISKVDGILYDLGVSSYHFDIPERGFSYNEDAILDMRMDQSQELTAKEVVNTYSAKDLMRIFSRYADIKYSPRLANAIVKYRENNMITRTLELVEIIKDATPQAIRRKAHPAKKAFQAIRIEVNKELEVLEKSLESALELLKKDGRIVVISFHSLEDRLVKNMFRDAVETDIPSGVPIRESDIVKDFRLITRKPIIPTDDEILANNRAHSAKMRIVEKIT